METITEAKIWQWLETIADPEIPVLSILDLGIVRKVQVLAQDSVHIDITPTYSGCPAMDVIGMQIRMLLLSNGIKNIEIKLVLDPAWTTDWMSDSGKEKLKNYGIAPPQKSTQSALALFEDDEIPCPRCFSENTTLISRFGATSCKSMYKCNNCLEPFEHFKCH
jgi:ring-1,2-phenylacetyl-CoA epoxidase subunit PaaD